MTKRLKRYSDLTLMRMPNFLVNAQKVYWHIRDLMHPTKRLLLLIILPYAISACTFHDEKKKGNELANSDSHLSELTQEQQSAFDALNELQTSTDEMNRIYSTFPNIKQPCYPADTSFEISQSELLTCMEKFISRHCQNLPQEDQMRLAKSSVLAQEKYTVLLCADNESNDYDENGFPMAGKWVIPNVLGRRDIIIVW